MGRAHDSIDEPLARWLQAQPVFFVATAPLDPDGHVNVSPKGNRGELVVLGGLRIAYLEQTGSGIETIAHIRDNGRIVVMACAFSGPPRIVRLHGRGSIVRPTDSGWDGMAEDFRTAGGRPDGPGVRSAVVVEVCRIADSCGYGVPLMELTAHRDTMDEWSARKGPEGVAAYQRQHNGSSIDGIPGLL